MGFLRTRSAECRRVVHDTPPPRPPPVVHDSGVDEELLSHLSEAFNYLYDPKQMDHLSLEAQLARFKKRDLNDAKFYKTALKYFGGQPAIMEKIGENKGRKRVIVAQPKHKYRGDSDDTYSEERSCALLGPCRSNVLEPSPPTPIDEKTRHANEYRSWLEQRKKLREGLERFGNTEKYLQGKPDRTSAERRVFKKILQSKKKVEVEEEELEEKVVVGKGGKDVAVKRPSPLALSIIDAELRRRKMRLIDLFTLVDKDKNWCLDRNEFKRAFHLAKINMPESLLEDLIITLDNDNDNELDYRELHKGLENFRAQRRLGKLDFAVDEMPSTLLSSRKHTNVAEEETSTSPVSTEASTILVAPSPDVREESFVNNNTEMPTDLRKRDRTALKRFEKSRQQADQEKWKGSAHVRKLRAPQNSIPVREVFQTGNPKYDDHCRPSTMLTGKPTLPPLENAEGIREERPLDMLDEEVADQVDRFRQHRFKEYMSLLKFCEAREIPFNHQNMERLLLHPGDQPPNDIRKHIRPPGGNRLNSQFHEAGKNADLSAFESSVFVDDRRSRRPGNLANLKDALPMAEELVVDDDEADVELSTGSAMIRRKVDCWLTFEQFCKITEHIDYSNQMHLGRSHANAFWPGQLKDKLRQTDTCVYNSRVFFQSTSAEKGARRSNYGYEPKQFFPLNNGHVTYASIDPLLRHQITKPKAL